MLARRNKVKQFSAASPSLLTEILVVCPPSDEASIFSCCTGEESGIELVLEGKTYTDFSNSEKIDFKRHDKRQNEQISTTSPARTLPLTPMCTPSPPQQALHESLLRTHSLLGEADKRMLIKEQQRRSSLKKLVCSKQLAEGDFILDNDVSTEIDDDSRITVETTPKRRPLLRKLICQKYKPSHHDEHGQSYQSRIHPGSARTRTHRMAPRELFSTNSSHNEHQSQESRSASFSTSPSSYQSFENTSLTPRIVQRLERAQPPSQNHLRLVHQLSSSLDDASIQELQYALKSFRPRTENSREELTEHLLAAVRKVHQSTSPNLHETASSPTTIRNNSISDSTIAFSDTEYYSSNPLSRNTTAAPKSRSVGGAAYQRRMERFQKEQNSEQSSSQDFLFGDDESSFVEWVAQIENVDTFQKSKEGFDYNIFTTHGRYPQAPATQTNQEERKKNSSMNTTAETSTYSSKVFDDNNTPDTESQTSEEDDLPRFRGQLPERKSTFDDAGSALVSVGSIDSSQFGHIHCHADATPEAIMAAAMAGDFDDDMWSGQISVKDEEFALAGVYSSPRVHF